MDSKINNKYWVKVKPEEIIGKNAFPGKELIKHLSKKAKVLDLGCGRGETCNLLFEKGFSVTGIDINSKAIKLNKLENKNINYICTDITKKLPFSDNYFDSILVSFVLVNILPVSKRKELVKEMSRILK